MVDGKLGQIGAFGDALVQQLIPQIQLHFVYGINAILTNTKIIGSGTTNSLDNMAILSTGGTTGSSVTVESRKIGKYYPGQGLVCRWTAILPGVVNGSGNVEIGLGTASYGCFIGRDSTGVYFNLRSNGVDNKLYYDDWTVNQRFRDNYDPTKGNIYEVHIAYLGFGPIRFEIMDPEDGKWVECDNIQYQSKNIVPNLENPHMGVRIHAENGNTTDDVIIKSASIGIFNEGEIKREASSIVSSFNSSLTGLTVDPTTILIIRNRILFNSKTNVMVAYLKLMSVGVDSTKLSIIRVKKDATIGGASFTNYNTNNSILEYSTVGTITGGTTLFNLNLNKTDSQYLTFKSSDNFFIAPGENISFELTPAASTDINLDVEFLEDL